MSNPKPQRTDGAMQAPLDRACKDETSAPRNAHVAISMIYGVLSKVTKTIIADGTRYVSVPEDVFGRLLAGAIKQKALFDEKFYLENYTDIAAAVKSGQISSGLEHYVVAGYFEGRFPKKLIVDERFYLQENPDVAHAIKKGLVGSAQEHFEAAGFHEGRAPYKGFSVF